MPLQPVDLVPGVTTQKTHAQAQAGVVATQLMRFKENLPQKYGGFSSIYTSTFNFPINALHTWQALDLVPRAAFATLSASLGSTASGRLFVASLASTSLVPQDITPFCSILVVTSSVSVVQTTSGSNQVTLALSASAVIGDQLFFPNGPIYCGGLKIYGGLYPVTAVSSAPATITFSSPDVATATATSSFSRMLQSSAGSAVISLTYPGPLPQGSVIQFGMPPYIGSQPIGGIGLYGYYEISNVPVSSSLPYTFTAQSAAVSSSGPFVIDDPFAVFLFRYQNARAGDSTLALIGNAIAPAAWTLDNWGNQLLACASGGAIFYWDPLSFASQASPVPASPPFNKGIFVSMPQQILIAYGSTPVNQSWSDPLLVRWSDAANYASWIATTTNQAGSFRLTSGSKIIGGLQAPGVGLVWTDIGLWSITYIGFPLVFQFLEIARGCGLVGPHAMGTLSGTVFWASYFGFFSYGTSGAQMIPCPVWDFFFQQIDRNNLAKVCCAVNSAFNEVMWYFPAAGGNGDNSLYVKLHAIGNEYVWDTGTLGRSAWRDIDVNTNPIGADRLGNIYTHESGNDASGVAMDSYMETGFFQIGDGTQLAFVDWVLPDMKWTTFGSTSTANVQFTFFTVDYPGDVERSYGPYTVTQGSEYINTRLRGRYVRMRVESNDLGSFWRLGRVSFRWQPEGRR